HGNGEGAARSQSRPQRRRHSPRPQRQSVPLYWLHADVSGHQGGGRRGACWIPNEVRDRSFWIPNEGRDRYRCEADGWRWNVDSVEYRTAEGDRVEAVGSEVGFLERSALQEWCSKRFHHIDRVPSLRSGYEKLIGIPRCARDI